MGNSSSSASAGSTDHGEVIECHSKDEFDKILERAKNEGKPVIVDFSAQWCGPCRKIGPEFVNLSKNHPNVIFVKIDVDEVQDLCAVYKVRAMPTFILLNPGSSEPAQTLLGADLSKLTSMVGTAAKGATTA
eukprot:TRINITY_DN299_c0_g1_i1.p1 TRINITY_DN299_c0_g1~~TRINITY_DN299_c0_g1_i1.p1  ORF type:complete len:132 (+),score=22.54 TRINITY_DN299_c0_g1_i1:338-733(+)